MKRTRILLFIFPLITALSLIACKKKEPPEPEISPAERARMEKRYLDSVDSVDRYYKKLAEEGQRYQDSLAKAYEAEEREAKKHGKGSSYSGSYVDDDEEEEEEEERRRKKREEQFNRSVDRGFFDENVKGWDRDNYDPDLDDW